MTVFTYLRPIPTQPHTLEEESEGPPVELHRAPKIGSTCGILPGVFKLADLCFQIAGATVISRLSSLCLLASQSAAAMRCSSAASILQSARFA